MIDYASQFITRKDISSINKILRNKFLTQGPITLKFENKINMYLFNNRLSCGIPKNLSAKNAPSLIILGNLLQYFDNSLPYWLSSPFKTFSAINLYLSSVYYYYSDYVFVCIGFICLFLLSIYNG